MDVQTDPDTLLTIDFRVDGNSTNFTTSHFSAPELLGCWMMGVQSRLVLPVSAKALHRRLKIKIFPCLIPLDVATAVEQTISVSVEGIKLGQFASSRTQWCELCFDIPADIVASDSGFVVTFDCPTPIVPADNSPSSDVRPLTFMVEKITFIGLSADQSQGSLPPPILIEPPSFPLSMPGDIVQCEPTAEVSQGKDGWLFLTGGSNVVLRYYTDPSYFTDDMAERWSHLLIDRQTKLAQRNVRYLHIAAPDKISVYPQYVAEKLPNFQRHPIALLAASLHASGHAALLINPIPVFQAHLDYDLLYLKTDTHWTYRAGQAVLEMVCARLGVPRRLSLSSRSLQYYEHIWDLGSKVDPQQSEQSFAVATLHNVACFHANHLALAFQENIRNGKPVTHRSIYAAFRSDAAEALPLTVVIFGDSYMDFQDSNTTTIFAEMFRELHFVWSPDIDYDFVASVGADVVITEQAERFMVTIPTDIYTVVT